MKKLLISILFLAQSLTFLQATNYLPADTFVRKLPREGSPEAMIKTSDGGYLICAYTNSDPVKGVSDVSLFKYSAYGEFLWVKDYFKQGRVNITDLMELSNGNLVLSGIYNYTPVRPVLLIVDVNGSIILEKGNQSDDTTQGYITWRSLVEISPDSFLVIALLDSSSSENYYTAIIVNREGDIIYENKNFVQVHYYDKLLMFLKKKHEYFVLFNIGGEDYKYYVLNKSLEIIDESPVYSNLRVRGGVINSVNNYAIFGYTAFGGGLLILSPQLDSLVYLSYKKLMLEGYPEQYGDKIAATQDGGYIYGGILTTFRDIIFLQKIDSLGKKEWNYQYYELNTTQLHGLEVADDGGIVMFTTMDSRKMFLTKFLSNGKPGYSTSIASRLEPGFYVYPSPAKNELHIQSQKTISSIAIYNLAGVYYKPNTTDYNAYKTLEISSLDAGYYIIQLYFEDGSVAKEKFIKIQ